MPAVVLVDASNVRRSRWPNVAPRALVDAVRDWARSEDVAVEIVFDGPPPEDADDLVGSGSESADDVIARRAAGLRAAGAEFWLVTSDRALRAEAGEAAARTIGGGGFLRLLGLSK